MFHEFLDNFTHNLFKPLLLFFYAGFTIPLMGVPFEFPHVIYQGLTMYLLIAIGWHGGEELATLSASGVQEAFGVMLIGFITNTIIGCVAYFVLTKTTKLRKIDAATVGGYYGSDSAGTFVTCLGVLGAAHVAYAAYMPVMLAVMEIPGCLVALFMVSRLRTRGMDRQGNMPGEPGYNPRSFEALGEAQDSTGARNGNGGHGANVEESAEEELHEGHGGTQVAVRPKRKVMPQVAHATARKVEEKPSKLGAFINLEL